MLMKLGTLVSEHRDVYSPGSMLWLPGDQGSRDFFPKLLGQISAYQRIAVRGLGVDMSTALGVNPALSPPPRLFSMTSAYKRGHGEPGRFKDKEQVTRYGGSYL